MSKEDAKIIMQKMFEQVHEGANSIETSAHPVGQPGEANDLHTRLDEMQAMVKAQVDSLGASNGRKD